MAGKDDPMEVEQCTEAVDQVASIPDDVIIRILSSLKDARLVAKCSLVSKRWQQMCSRVQTLHFYSGLFKGHNDYEEIVRGMVLKTCELRSLQVALHQDRHTMADGNRPRGISDRALFEWLDHISNHLENFYISDLGDGPPDAQQWTGRFNRLATCTMLKTLVLSNSEITHPPSVNASPLSRLKSLTLYGVVCGAEAAEKVLALCPRLEKLLITGCLGVTTLQISNPCLTTFALKEPPTPVSNIVLKTPALTRLSLEQVAGVSLESGRVLTKLHLRSDHSIVLNLQNTGNLQDLKIVGKGWDWDSIQQLLYANPKVKNVAFYIKCRDQIHANGVPVEPVRLDRFFYTLQEVRKMEIGAELMWVLSAGRLDASPGLEANPVWMPKVQEIKLGAVKAKQVYIDVLGALLNRCPELKRVVVDTSQLKKSSWNCSSFFSDVLRLQREHPTTDIKVNMPDLFVPPKGRE